MFFDHSYPRSTKNDLGEPWRRRVGCGWAVSQKITKITKKGPKMCTKTRCFFFLCVCFVFVFCTTFSSRGLKNICIHFFRTSRWAFLNGGMRVYKKYLFPKKKSSTPKNMAWGGRVTPPYLKNVVIYGSWPNWAPPLLVPSFLTRIFARTTSSKKVVFF